MKPEGQGGLAASGEGLLCLDLRHLHLASGCPLPLVEGSTSGWFWLEDTHLTPPFSPHHSV